MILMMVQKKDYFMEELFPMTEDREVYMKTKKPVILEIIKKATKKLK